MTGSGLTRAIFNTLNNTGPGQVQTGPSGAAPPTADPTTIALVKRYEPQVRNAAAGYLRGEVSGDRAWALAKAELTRSSAGRALVDALQRGDYVGATRLVPAALQSLPPR